MDQLSIMGFDGFPFSDADRVRLERASQRLKFRKKASVIQQGEPCPYIYFLHSGLVKLCYHTLAGKEFIKSFIREGGMFGSLHSLVNGGGSTFSVIALEALEMDAVDYRVFKELVEKYPELQSVSIGYFQQLALKKEMREYELLCLSAQERYQRFCNQEPEILDRITQADLALYLGITPVALSRLKRKKGNG